MDRTPSLLDWLNYHLSQPRNQRLARFGLALLAAAWGVSGMLANGPRDLGALFLLALAAGLVAAGLMVRGGAPAMSAGAMPAVGLGTRGVYTGLSRDEAARLLAGLRLPTAVLLAILGQLLWLRQPPSAAVGGLLYVLGALLFTGTVIYDRLLGGPRVLPSAVDPAEPAEAQFGFRWRWLGVALLAGAVAFFAAGGNEFTTVGVAAWIVSVAAWLGAAWEAGGNPAEWLAGLRQRAAQRLSAVDAEGVSLRLSRGLLLFLLVLAVGAYFRFARLEAIPPEMTSDHVEKLLDVNDVLQGQGRRPIFFERNTGREPLQFYFAALVDWALNTGVTHLTLKITGAVAGFLLLPFLYLLGRELEDERLGLLAMLLAGFAFWPTAISRVGLRFPLTPLFVAPVLFFLLRGLRRASRNDFLLAGLFLGAGLYGYSTIRVLPVLLVAGVVLFAAWPQPAGARRKLLANSILLFATAFVVFVPLYRYALEDNSYFWYRSLSRLSDAETALPGPPLQTLVQNNWNALRMFNWQGDDVWVNTIPGLPVLDAITGALFVLGVVFLLARLVLRRDFAAAFLLLALPLLLLPSTLSLAYPDENPSVVRAGGSIPVVFLMAAYPAWLLLQALGRAWNTPGARRASLAALGGLLLLAGLANYRLYFVRYPAQYLGAAQNASEIGAAVRGFANSVGSLDRAYMCLHPHWADTRAVGLYAGRPGWEQVLPAEQFAALAAPDPRPLLVVVNPRSDACLAALPAAFPTGAFSQYYSARGPDKDFLLFFVPGTPATEGASQ